MSFPRYPEYKDSGIEWLGEVPAHWELKRLKRNFRLRTDKTDRREHPVGLENIESWTGRFVPTQTEFEGEGIAFDQGDILFGKLRPYLAKVYLAKSSGEAVGDFHVMHPLEVVVGRFAQYQLLTRSFIDIVDGSTFGSKIRLRFIEAKPIAMPEMERIAAAIVRVVSLRLWSPPECCPPRFIGIPTVGNRIGRHAFSLSESM